MNVMDVEDGYNQILRLFKQSGTKIGNTSELINLTVRLPIGCKKLTHPSYSIKSNVLNEYIQQFVSSINYAEFPYTYGERIFNPNQVEMVIRRLKKDKYSRKAIIHTYRVDIDTYEEDIPCLQTIHFYIRDDKLQCTALFRSNDMLNAWISNVNGLIYLSKIIARELNVGLGHLTTISTLAHVYLTEVDWYV